MIFMRTLYFEPVSGASGDMIIGSLIDLGADADLIRRCAESCADVKFSARRVDRHGISATDIDFEERSGNNERHLNEIIASVSAAGLPAEIENDAKEVFGFIARAESKVHHKDIDHLHFHETGQDDAIADVVGCCAAFYDLSSKYGFSSVRCAPVNVGGGTVHCMHGELPVPAPAVLEILKESGLPYYSRGDRELLTPTGAAVLAYFTKKYGSGTPDKNAPDSPDTPNGLNSPNCPIPEKVIAIGYGSGKADTASPNVLRSSVLETAGTPGLFSKDGIEILETNVDDVTGEVIGNLIESLMKNGARDAAVIPLTMKKGRPGQMIRVVCKGPDSQRLAEQIIRETGTLGVRVIPTKHRITVEREIAEKEIVIAGKQFRIPVKIARLSDGSVIHVSAEYENCRTVAAESGIPLRDVIRIAEEEANRVYGKY